MEGMSGILLGAFLALLGGVVTLVVEKSWEAKATRLRVQNEQSALAFSIVVKLTQMYAWSIMVQRGISECFRDASGTLGEDSEPGVKVQPLIGASSRVDSLSSQELGLVLGTNDQGLLERVLQVQGNYRSTYDLVQHFNSARKEFSAFILEHAEFSEIEDGLFSKSSLPGSMKGRGQTYIAVLNQLVGEILQSAEEDRNATEAVIRRLQTAFSELEGVEYPKILFQKDAEKC